MRIKPTDMSFDVFLTVGKSLHTKIKCEHINKYKTNNMETIP